MLHWSRILQFEFSRDDSKTIMIVYEILNMFIGIAVYFCILLKYSEQMTLQQTIL